MSHSISYPADVAAEFFVRENQSSLNVGRLLAKLHSPTAQYPSPSQTVLARLIETMFFASMATEEGHLTPVGIVYAENFASFQAARPIWDLVRFASHQTFEVSRISKLASACGSLDSLLIVMPQSEDLVLTGIATPHSRGFLDRDHLVRILILKPGVISVRRNEWEIVRYVYGKIPPKPLSLAGRGGKHRTQLDSIEQAVFSEKPEHIHIQLEDFLLRIASGMARLGHGGLLAVLGPEDDPEHLLKESKRLAEPLRFGAALRDMHDAQLAAYANDQERFSLINGGLVERPMTEDEQSDAAAAEEANNRVSRLLDQIIRLTTVDGAVVMNHALDVLAFGAKLPSKKTAPKVFSVNQGRQPGAPWPLSQRGTRHRTAAIFAKQHPLRLALIVSQDGDAASLQQIDSAVVYWPLLG